MTINISENNPRITYSIAEGLTQTVFSVPFEFFDNNDLVVYVDGVTKAEGLDYTIIGGDGSTGTITFVTATPPDVQQVTGAAGGTEVTIARHMPIERTTDFLAGQDINRAALNTQLDEIVSLVADLDDKVSRTIHLNDYEVAPSMLLEGDRKGRVLAFNSTTGDVEVGPLSNDIATIANNIAEILAADDEAAAAAASATSAATSAAATAADRVQTGLDRTATAADVAQTAANLLVTDADTVATAADRVQTGLDAAATAADRVQTTLDVLAAASSASTASAASDAALAALDSFDDRYLGQKTIDPTLDNDGDPLVAGALYFNTSDEIMKVFDGSLWVAAYASLSGAMFGANNLSDVADVTSSRVNLGLGSASTTESTDYATAAQGSLADSSVQPADLATVASTGSYNDLSGLPTLGTAASTASTDYATAAQGVLADTAVQPNDSPTFADLTLSGGVYLGGTGAANKLDDYEEGTWTPTFISSAGPTSITGITVVEAVYTKIGNFVRLRARISFDRATEATYVVGHHFTLGGLPFTANPMGSTGIYGTVGQCHVYESLGSNSNAWGFITLQAAPNFNMFLQTLNGNPDTGDDVFLDMSYTT